VEVLSAGTATALMMAQIADPCTFWPPAVCSWPCLSVSPVSCRAACVGISNSAAVGRGAAELALVEWPRKGTPTGATP